MRLLGLALGLLLAVPARGAEQELALYPGAVHTRIGDTLVIGGLLYRMAYFTTETSMGEVARHFLETWRREGYPTTVDGALVDEGVVSAVATREGLLRSVVLRRHAGRTVGLTVLRDLWALVPRPVREGGLPPLEGTLYAQDVEARSTPTGALQRSALLEADLALARARVSSQLTGAGLALVREREVETEGRPALVLEHGDGAQHVVTTLLALQPGLTALTQTHLTTATVAPGGQVP